MNARFSTRMTIMQPSSIRELLKVIERPEIISFAGGLPAPELFPVAEIRVAAGKALAEIGSQAMQYGATEGIKPLREKIAAEMGRRGVACTADDILITTGSQQSLDLLGKIFLDPGDSILTENPTYLAAIQAFQCFEARFIPIPMDEDGLIPEVAEELAKMHKPKFLYTIPNFQNPTGRTLARARRAALCEVARRQNFVIVEDDPYGRLRYRGTDVAPIKSWDEKGTVVSLSTFSKVIAPGIRTGWAVAPKYVRERMIVAKQAADLHTSSLDQIVIDRYLADNDNAAHVELVRCEYGKRCEIMEEALADCMPSEFTWTHPDGGMFLWVTGPEGLDTHKLLFAALQRGVAFVPGRNFFPDASGSNCLRLNFSNAQPAKLREGIKRLADCVRLAINAG
jgi:2-aminoadipate transaminase